jgi:hypothetical protein
LRSERVEQYIDIRLERVGRPTGRRFCHESRHFAEGLPVSRDRADLRGPRVDLARGDRRLRTVIDDDAEIGVTLEETQKSREMTRVYECIERQFRTLHRGDRRRDRGTE